MIFPSSLPLFPHFPIYPPKKKTENREYPANGPYNFTKRINSCAFYKKRVFLFRTKCSFFWCSRAIESIGEFCAVVCTFFQKVQDASHVFRPPFPHQLPYLHCSNLLLLLLFRKSWAMSAAKILLMDHAPPPPPNEQPTFRKRIPLFSFVYFLHVLRKEELIASRLCAYLLCSSLISRRFKGFGKNRKKECLQHSVRFFARKQIHCEWFCIEVWSWLKSIPDISDLLYESVCFLLACARVYSHTLLLLLIFWLRQRPPLPLLQANFFLEFSATATHNSCLPLRNRWTTSSYSLFLFYSGSSSWPRRKGGEMTSTRVIHGERKGDLKHVFLFFFHKISFLSSCDSWFCPVFPLGKKKQQRLLFSHMGSSSVIYV